MRKRKCGIYCIENIINDKKYIGQSVNIDKRKTDHKSFLNKGGCDCKILQRAWNKYGEKIFKFYIIEECLIDELDEKEKYWIKELHSHKSEWGYNISWGGDAPMKGRKHTEEWRKEKSKAMSGENHPMWGKHHSEESIKLMIENTSGEKNHNYGIPKTDEIKKKMSYAKQGKICSYEHRLAMSKTRLKNKSASCSKYFGVSIRKRNNSISYNIDIRANGIRYSKSYKNELDAAKAYNKYVIDNNLPKLLNFSNDKNK